MKILKILIFLSIALMFSTSVHADSSENKSPKKRFDQLLIPGGIKLAELAELAYASVHFHEEDFKLHEDYHMISTRIDQSCGFQGIACEHKESGKMIIAFAGTQAGMDPLDLIADVGILLVGIKQLKIKTKELIEAIFNLNNDNYGLYEINRIENEWLALFNHAAERGNYRNNKTLKSQVNTAKDFLKEIRDECRKRKINFKNDNTILVGHSLGGFIAQVLGNENSNTVHTFNAPGAYAYGNLINDRKIYNHIRKNDGVGRFGIHLGQNIIYPNTKMHLAILPPVYFVKNHTIELFYKDLQKGMTGYFTSKEYR